MCVWICRKLYYNLKELPWLTFEYSRLTEPKLSRLTCQFFVKCFNFRVLGLLREVWHIESWFQNRSCRVLFSKLNKRVSTLDLFQVISALRLNFVLILIWVAHERPGVWTYPRFCDRFKDNETLKLQLLLNLIVHFHFKNYFFWRN